MWLFVVAGNHGGPNPNRFHRPDEAINERALDEFEDSRVFASGQIRHTFAAHPSADNLFPIFQHLLRLKRFHGEDNLCKLDCRPDGSIDFASCEAGVRNSSRSRLSVLACSSR